MIWDIIISALLVIGGFFGLVGFPRAGQAARSDDAVACAHQGGDAGGGGGAVGLDDLVSTQQGQVTWHELLIALFLFLTAPMTGFFIAKAHMHLGWDASELPRPAPDRNWATFASPEQDSPFDRRDAKDNCQPEN